MEKSYNDGRTCSICEHPITDNNPDGIGFGCREIWNKARCKAFYHFNPFVSWEAQLNVIIPLFIDLYKDVKFRSNFKKSFYPSICNIWETHKRISKKQKDICINWISEKTDNDDWEDFDNSINKAKKIYQNWTPKTKEEIEYLNNCVAMMYAESKKQIN